MEHKHSVYDSDLRFVIDPVTKVVKNTSKKTTIAQYSHNSERITFELPRYIEGHDMSLCNKAEVHYQNLDIKTKETKTGLYTAEDLQIDPENEEKVICTWLISNNGTQLAGLLNFVVWFICEENSVITYAWPTLFNSELIVGNSFKASELVLTEYVDVIEQWKESVMQTFRDDLSAWKETKAEELQADLTAWKEAESDEVHRVMGDYETHMNKQLDVERKRIDNIVALKDGSTTGDAELQDARVTFDGKVCANAGAAVREQIKNLSDMLITDAEWQEGLYISSNGEEILHENYSVTEFIPLRSGAILPTVFYRVRVVATTNVALYDSNKMIISVIALTDSTTLQVCEGILRPDDYGEAHYIRISSWTDYDAKRVCFGNSEIPKGVINTEYLANQSVTNEKIVDRTIGLEKVSFLTHHINTNYIDKTRLTIDCYVNASGVVMPYSGFRLSDYIELKENTNYYHGYILNGYYAFYDAAYNLMFAAGNDNSLKNPFQIPSGAAYGRFTMISPEKAENAWIHTRNEQPIKHGYALDGVGLNPEKFKPTEYNGNDICVFSHGLCIGDSLTQGTMNYLADGSVGNYVNIEKYSYPSILAKMTGIPIKNMGIGGATADEWYAKKANSDLSGYDFAIIQFGVNDAYRYGDWTNVSKQAFTNIVTKLKNENKNIKIFISTIIPAKSYTGEVYNNISQGIRDFVSELADESVILLDLAVHGHTADDTAYNCGHLSAYGYWRLARDYSEYISWYMNENKELFREVQFIGTDYVFTEKGNN